MRNKNLIAVFIFLAVALPLAAQTTAGQITGKINDPSGAAIVGASVNAINSATGVSRKTAKRLAEQLGVDETQAIHRALHELAVKVLPQYEQDDGPLAAAQVRQIKKRVPQGTKRSVRSSLIETELA